MARSSLEQVERRVDRGGTGAKPETTPDRRSGLAGENWLPSSRNWTAFQGTKPDGDTPYAYVPMCDNIEGAVNRSLKFLKTIA